MSVERMDTRATPSSRLRVDGPTPLTLPELTELVRQVAGEVAVGRYPVEFDELNRWSIRLSSDDYADVWLISWTREQSTELHDHAGSLGALTVVRGTLTERYWGVGDDLDVPTLRTRRLEPPACVGFPVGHVHDVVNTDQVPAVSVHAYSPPLTAMSYYEVDPVGALRRTHSVLTDDPEPDAPTIDLPTARSAGR